MQTIASIVQSPEITCISIEGNNILVDWKIPTDPNGDFLKYNLYFSSNATSGYANIATVSNYSQSSYTYNYSTFTGNNAYFYLTTSNKVGNESTPSDTVQPIFLTLDNTQESIAVLNWEGGIFYDNYYQIFKRKKGEVWQWIDSTDQFSYTDSIAVCSDSIYYRIELANDIRTCVSKSNIAVELFEDNFAPTPPKIDSVSVDPSTGFVHIGWEVSKEGDVGGYIVALKRGNNWILDTVWGKNNTHFVDNNANAYDNIETYGLLAFDTCWSGVPASPNTSASGATHSTMLLYGESDACSRSITLNWNGYVGWDDGISEYELYVSESGGQRYLLETLSASTLSYTHDSLIPNANYCYKLVARNGSRTYSSSSNRICITMLVPKLPNNHYLNKVTVADDNSIEVSCFVDNKAAIEYYLVERSSTHDGPYEVIHKIVPPTDSIIMYKDYDVDPSSAIYFYKITAVDVCGYAVNISNVSTNVYTRVVSLSAEFVNQIKWNAYSDWDTLGSGVAFYYVYKGYSESEISDTPLALVDRKIQYYEDEIDVDGNNTGEVCYMIEAIEADGNLLAFKERSYSNISCVKLEPVVYIPSAFTPDGDRLNEEFKPVLNFVPTNNYSFTIFSRYGKVIFQTNDPNTGWSGDNYPTGVYTYKVVFTSSSGKVIEKLGAITLIK